MAVTRPLFPVTLFPVPVFAAAGVGAWPQVQELRGRTYLRLVESPRHASVLLIAGAVPSDWVDRLRRVHDQVPHPRRTVAWVGERIDHPNASETCTGSIDELAAAIVAAHRVRRA